MAIKPELLKGWGPGGWAFFQPETNWHAPGPLENSFEAQVKNIIAMRKLNPRFNLPTDEPTVAAELEAFQEARWAKTYSKRGMEKFQAGPIAPDKKKEPSFILHARKVLDAGAELAGVDPSSLEEWLGAGGVPVQKEVAYRRAAMCANCPGNQKAGWRELLTIPAAKALRAYLSSKNDLKLETTMDANLGSCQACHCVLELKVWQPPEFIRDNTQADVIAKQRSFNPECWAANEAATSKLLLPDVTLVAIDSFKPHRTIRAMQQVQELVSFGDTVLVTTAAQKANHGFNGRVMSVLPSSARSERERYLTTRITETFTTSHCLHMEWDAGVNNPAAWDPSWLEYDFLGAPWPAGMQVKGFPVATEEARVGNTGFCLMSKRFADALANVSKPSETVVRGASDFYVCISLRPTLEKMGIRFAPPEVAYKFSCENKLLTDQFGWHGQMTAAMNRKPLSRL